MELYIEKFGVKTLQKEVQLMNSIKVKFCFRQVGTENIKVFSEEEIKEKLIKLESK